LVGFLGMVHLHVPFETSSSGDAIAAERALVPHHEPARILVENGETPVIAHMYFVLLREDFCLVEPGELCLEHDHLLPLIVELGLELLAPPLLGIEMVTSFLQALLDRP